VKPRAPRFASVVIDVDSTLCGIEGVDWLARLRGDSVAREIATLTDRAMNGEITLDAVYGERLALIRPTHMEIRALADAYRQQLAAGAADVVRRLRAARIRVVLVSGGLQPAIAPLAAALDAELQAVGIDFDADGSYRDFDRASPLASQDGKRRVVRDLNLARPALAVGDGSTDVAMRPEVDEFAAFTGFARREAVVRAADREFATFGDLASYVLDREKL
jgi:HAD superfamily phosphoserine phosphatase-like hydrolase